jgi:hypothetical protein
MFAVVTGYGGELLEYPTLFRFGRDLIALAEGFNQFVSYLLADSLHSFASRFSVTFLMRQPTALGNKTAESMRA